MPIPDDIAEHDLFCPKIAGVNCAVTSAENNPSNSADRVVLRHSIGFGLLSSGSGACPRQQAAHLLDHVFTVHLLLL